MNTPEVELTAAEQAERYVKYFETEEASPARGFFEVAHKQAESGMNSFRP